MALRAGLNLAPGRRRPPPSSAPALRVDGLSVRLAGREILHDVTFSVAAGEVTGLIGMNGAGKTTLLRALLGLQPISSGRVAWPLADPAASRPGTCRKRWSWTRTCRCALATWSSWGWTAAVWASRSGPAANAPSSNVCWPRSMLCTWPMPGSARSRAANSKRSSSPTPSPAAHCLLLLDEPLANLDLPSTQETVSLARPDSQGTRRRHPAVRP